MSERTVLLVGNFRPSLCVARALAEAGHRVIAGASSRTSVELSRFVSETWRHPPIRLGDGAFAGALAGFLRDRPDVSVVYPVNQVALVVLGEIRRTLPVAVVTAEPSTVRACLDKAGILERVRTLGIPHARFALAERPGVVEAARSVGFPCVVKPNDADLRFQKALILSTEAEVGCLRAWWPPDVSHALVQRFAHGVRHNRYFIARDGRVLDRVEVRTVRTDRPDGTGYGVEGFCVDPLEALDEPTDRLLGSLSYTGVGCVQYLVDEDEGTISFLEINPRLGGNYAFTHACGLDQASAAMALALDEPNEPRSRNGGGRSSRGPIGLRYAWLTGDLAGIAGSRSRGEITTHEALTWLGRAIRSALSADRHLVWCPDDPLPALGLAADLLRSRGAMDS